MRSSMITPLRRRRRRRCSGLSTPIAARRLASGRNFAVLANAPRRRRIFGLRHRPDVIRARAHRGQHLVDHRRREVVDELEVHLHARRAVARRQTLDFFVGEEPVRRRSEMADAELLAEVRHDVFGVLDRARQAAADLQHVLADRPPEKQRVERDRRLDDGRRHVEQLRSEAHRFATDVAFVLLKQMHHRKQRRALVLVLRDDPLGLGLQPAKRRKVASCTERSSSSAQLGAARRSAHRSTSPKTGSSEPIMTTRSAIRLPTAMPLSTCRLYILGGRVRTRYGRFSPLLTT